MRLDVSPKNVILQVVSPMQLSEGLSLVSVLPPKGKKKGGGLNLHLKWHIVPGMKRGQMKRTGIFECRKTSAVFYLFVLIARSVLSNQLYSSP